ncbi:hypothetical protein M2336_003636 [Sphingobium sp. B1D7B]|nr:hypothetical protein [Sphingobium sp. B1D7B]
MSTLRAVVRRWLIAEAPTDVEPEPWPEDGSFYRGLLIGLPLAIVLWVIIIRLVWSSL